MHHHPHKAVVIGGGIIGLCSAWQLLEQGVETVVIDSAAQGGDNGARENAGMIVPSHFIPLAAPGMMAKGLRWLLNPESPFAIRVRPDPALARWGWLFHRHSTAEHVRSSAAVLRDLNFESRRLFAALADGGENFGLVKRGLVMLCKTQRALDGEGEVAEMAKSIGIQADVLDASGVAALDPGIRMSIAGGVHFPEDCHLDPSRLLDCLRARVIRMGGRVVHGVIVDEVIRNSDGRLCEVRGEDFSETASHIVIAGGIRGGGLLDKLGVRLPMQPGKGYSLTLDAPVQLPQLCSILSEAKVAVTPIGGRLRFAGTMEIGARDDRANPARLRGIIRSAHDYFPGIEPEAFEGLKPWVGHRPVSPDGLPYLGRARRDDNLIIATGHAMMGLSLGPVTGQAVAALVTGQPPFRDLSALDPARFSR
ncbi:MAG: NAD(P)/FAD-dependent oxidoreductase [Luteolibacter sp.]|jgi:D-amino-acid dehydrogenase